MPTREVLAPSQRAQFTELPATLSERDLARYYTLSPEDLAVIAQRRRPHNQLGFAVQLAYLRFPGRPLRAGEQPPEAVVTYLAAQLDLDPAVLEEYARERDTTRREHLLEIQRVFGFRPFSTQTYRELVAWLLPTALSTDSGMALVTALVEEMRVRKIVAPALYLVERLAWETRRRAEQQMFHRLTASLTPEQCVHLDALLTVPPERSQTVLVWLRQPPGKPAPATILKLIERLNAIRVMGLDHTLSQQIHQNWLRKLAREGARYTPSFLARFDGPRRYATLVAFLLESAATLADQILDLHDRLMTQYLRRSEQADLEPFHQSGRQINEKVRLYASVGKALIAARQQEQDPYQAIAAVLPWERFVQRVAEAEQLTQPEAFDSLDHLDVFYGQVRRYAPIFWRPSPSTTHHPVVPSSRRCTSSRSSMLTRPPGFRQTPHAGLSNRAGHRMSSRARLFIGTPTNSVPCMHCGRACGLETSGSRAAASSKPLKTIFCPLLPGRN